MNTFETSKSDKSDKGDKGDKGGKAKRSNGVNGESRPAVAPALEHRHILAALRAFRRGDFSAKMREDLAGVDGQICDTFNEIVELVRTIREEASDVSISVGKQGQAAKRMRRFHLSGGWADYVQSVNEVINDLTGHANEIARVVAAVARGDLEETMDIEGATGPRRGEFLRDRKSVV